MSKLLAAGAFDRQQALNSGFSATQIRHRLEQGEWIRVLPQVYRHVACPESPGLLRRAALLWAGSDGALSYATAGVLWNLDRVAEPRPALTIPEPRRLRSKLVTVHRATLPQSDITHREGLRSTNAVRTIIDLAGELADEDLEAAFESARRQRLVTVEAVRRRHEQLGTQGRRGAGRLTALLTRLDGRAPSESVFEVKVARLLRTTTLPEPVRQYDVTIFGRRYRLDLAWPERRVALECDGRAFHEFQRDRTRWRHLGASGWRVLPVTWDDVARNWPAVCAELASALTGVR
jgi:very-short-patch-repair endonuclease